MVPTAYSDVVIPRSRPPQPARLPNLARHTPRRALSDRSMNFPPISSTISNPHVSDVMLFHPELLIRRYRPGMEPAGLPPHAREPSAVRLRRPVVVMHRTHA